VQPQIGSLSHDTAMTNLIFCQHLYGTTTARVNKTETVLIYPEMQCHRNVP